jgi:hypothetical protein
MPELMLSTKRLVTYILVPILILIIPLIIAAGYQTTPNYNPNDWIGMSIAFGAAALTLVSILTSFLTSAENDRRTEFRETLNQIYDRLEKKSIIYESFDRSLKPLYDSAKIELQRQIEIRSPLKYSEGIFGFISFFLFLFSIFFVIFGWSFQWIVGSFLLGVGVLVNYLVYCIFEFYKMDVFSSVPEINGALEILFISINGEKVELSSTRENTYEVPIPKDVQKIEFQVRFSGETRNGFLHAVVKYTNGIETHYPDRNTYLIDFGFIDNYRLTLLEPLDTGVIQTLNSTILIFDLVLRSKANENTIIAQNIPISILGIKNVFRYCSLPDDFNVESIKLRIWEDPYYKPNYKRRKVTELTILPKK